MVYEYAGKDDAFGFKMHVEKMFLNTMTSWLYPRKRFINILFERCCIIKISENNSSILFGIKHINMMFMSF